MRACLVGRQDQSLPEHRYDGKLGNIMMSPIWSDNPACITFTLAPSVLSSMLHWIICLLSLIYAILSTGFVLLYLKWSSRLQSAKLLHDASTVKALLRCVLTGHLLLHRDKDEGVEMVSVNMDGAEKDGSNDDKPSTSSATHDMRRADSKDSIVVSMSCRPVLISVCSSPNLSVCTALCSIWLAPHKATRRLAHGINVMHLDLIRHRGSF